MKNDLGAARADARRSSGAGIGFLLAYGLTMSVVAVLAFLLPVRVAVLAFLFQGGVALPLAFFLERRLGFPPMAEDNPLRPLVIQVAMIQVVALPAAILTYAMNPAYAPAVFASVAGGHFLPYAWLNGTRAYLALGVAVSLVPFALMVVWGSAAMPFVPLSLALMYGAMAIVLRAGIARDARTVGAA